MSDIHGDVSLFKEALQQVHFNSDDVLFVIGDMIEKGNPGDSLKMMRYMLELSKQENVHFMAGNCDEIFRFILPPMDHKLFLYYALERKRSIINDLAEEMNVTLSPDMDIPAFVSQMMCQYKAFYEFIDQLDDVLFINDELVLVHGGIADIHEIPKDSIDVLKFDRFLEVSKPQPKIMIVGHYPTRNYHSDICDVNPIFDLRKRIICIDGGNNIVKGGQINIVLLENLASMRFSFEAVDHYPKYVMKEDAHYEATPKRYNIQFGQNEVEILSKDLDFYHIRPIGMEDSLWVHDSLVYSYHDKFYCFDGSNDFISLNKGDKISIVKHAQPYTIVKYEGRIGLIETKYIQ